MWKWIITTPRGRGWMEAHPFLGTSWKYPSTKTDKYIPFKKLKNLKFKSHHHPWAHLIMNLKHS
jgi:hypothetical protein